MYPSSLLWGLQSGGHEASPCRAPDAIISEASKFSQALELEPGFEL